MCYIIIDNKIKIYSYMVNEIELYVDTINDFPYEDYITICEKNDKEPQDNKSKDFKNWNKDMKLIVYRMFLVKLKHSTVADNLVTITSKKGSLPNQTLRQFLTDIFAEYKKFRLVREIEPDKLSLLVIDDNKKRTTYKITFVDSNISYEHIF